MLARAQEVAMEAIDASMRPVAGWRGSCWYGSSWRYPPSRKAAVAGWIRTDLKTFLLASSNE
jgi:hypothetical protein